MSRGALGAFGSACFFLVAIINFWTSASANRLGTKFGASSASLNDTEPAWSTPTRGESQEGPAAITAEDVVEASPQPKQRWWSRLLRWRKPKSKEMPVAAYDESKLMRLPTFMREDKTFRDRMRRWFDKINERVHRKQVISDLYKRHAEDERVYGGDSEDDM